MNWPVSIIAGELEVRFDRRSDRVEHGVWMNGLDGPLLVSVEGDANDAWPASPPFQELTLEVRSGRCIALLVGRAGTSHWSACVEPAAESEEISLDIACRCQQPPQWLGSRYQISPQATTRAAGGAIAISRDGHSLNVAGSNQRETSTLCRIAGDLLEIAPQQAPARLPTTVRWWFTLAIARH